ncbi:MAG: FeoB small GTPase domain-containing protein, partial [candidate division NC10 bacterium]|nr:FeoB small GTPase domain-containing protein [candidate division NC10 bacterium]
MARDQAVRKKPRIILLGNPNVGKSVIFGHLTGHYVTVSNYPGTTVEVTRGEADLDHKPFEILDTPGVNNLIPLSEEERVTRDILLKEDYQLILQVADAKNLRRSLLLTLQLAEMGIPFLLDLNLMDEAQERGVQIDVQRLSEILGIGVVPTVATQKKGLERLIRQIGEARPSSFHFPYTSALERGIQGMEPHLPETRLSKRSLALMVLAGDLTLQKWLQRRISPQGMAALEQIRKETASRCSQPLNYLIDQERLQETKRILEEVWRVREGGIRRLATSLERFSVHPIAGLPLLLLLLILAYLFVGVFGAQICVDFLSKVA